MLWLMRLIEIRANASTGPRPVSWRHLSLNLAVFAEGDIPSGGHVVDTLTASLWCLLTSSDFAQTVLKAVNLGGDTDTTGIAAGGLAGVRYGIATRG